MSHKKIQPVIEITLIRGKSVHTCLNEKHASVIVFRIMSRGANNCKLVVETNYLLFFSEIKYLN